jgi:hypothetical protein
MEDLADRLAIFDIYSRYAWAMDTGDREMFEAVWTAEATWVCEALRLDLHGRDAILRYFDKGPGRLPAVPDLGGNIRLASLPILDIDGDTARGRAEMAAFRVEDSSVCTYTIGKYDDRLERTADGWRIAHRDMIVSPVVMPARRP